VLQDESYNINLAISYSNGRGPVSSPRIPISIEYVTNGNSDPTSNSDFSTVVPSKDFPELYPGHECYAVPNPPSTVVAASNATLQIQYTSSFDTSQNQTFYACADIVYVPLNQFTTNVPCFNVSIQDPEIISSKIVGATTSPTSTGISTASATGTTAASPSHSGLSGGAIAGIVVGAVVGGSLALGALFFLWRSRKRARRQKAVEFRMNELTSPVKPSTSATSNEQ
jgi:hypothetical protein